MLHATSANASPRPSGDRSRQPLAPPLGSGDREQFAQRFLRVAQQLDALQPVRPHPPSSTPGSRAPDSLLPAAFSRERVMEIFRQNARFRPCEAVARPAAAAVSSAPPTEPRDLRLKLNAPKRRVAVTNAMARRFDGSAQAAASMSALYPAVGGKARALPSTELARMKEALKKRSLALANVHSAVSTTPAAAVVPSEDTALQVATEGETEGSDGDSVQHGKQALVAKLVQLSGFSTTHIFQLSRLFKATAGAVKSVIDFEDFHQVLSAGMATLLPSPPPALPQYGHNLRAAEQQEGQPELNAPPSENLDLLAIGATIASSETFVRRLFQAFDTDGDGHIDVREFIVGLNGVVTGSAEDKAAALFEIYRNDHPPPAATAPEGKNAPSPPPRQPKVPITELLGLFQGDRQHYQELMRCVEDYFVRVQLNDGATMTTDQFVSASLAEPRLLRHVSRSVASERQRESDDPKRRELLRQLVARARLRWQTLARIQHRMNLSKTTTPFSTDDLIQIVVEEVQQQTSGGEEPQQLEHESETSALSMEELTQSLVLTYRATSPSQVPTRGVGAPGLEGSGLLQADNDLLKDLAGALQTSSLAASAPDATADQARFFFEHFDVDGDGRMTQHELAAGLGARMGAQVLDVARLLEEEDDDQDGQLSPEEYLRAAHKSPLILASLYTCL
ncbi:hypothetical protein BBJ28_00007210 [Nothophytophthora sp. Chile5]|nr:hypothetical protein BBJ28_00007210 [Nothophytophthora sp. Chile5]